MFGSSQTTHPPGGPPPTVGQQTQSSTSWWGGTPSAPSAANDDTATASTSAQDVPPPPPRTPSAPPRPWHGIIKIGRCCLISSLIIIGFLVIACYVSFGLMFYWISHPQGECFFTAMTDRNVVHTVTVDKKDGASNGAQPVVFQAITSKYNADYNRHTGIFTVQVAGKYMLYAQFNNLVGNAKCNYYINGKKIRTTEITTTQTRHILYLAKGDTLSIRPFIPDPLSGFSLLHGSMWSVVLLD